MVTDEGQMRAACVMREAADKFATHAAYAQDNAQMGLQRLEELMSRFETAVERLITERG